VKRESQLAEVIQGQWGREPCELQFISMTEYFFFSFSIFAVYRARISGSLPLEFPRNRRACKGNRFSRVCCCSLTHLLLGES